MIFNFDVNHYYLPLPQLKVGSSGISDQQQLGLLVIVIGVFFFKILDTVLDKVLWQYSYLAVVKTLQKKGNGQYKFKNYFLSMIHSMISSIWLLLCFYSDPRLLQDMINPSSPLSVALVCFSIGYFIHDVYHILINDHSRSSMEIIPHHAIVIFCFGLSIYWERFVAYAVVALLVEVNSIFLHGRQILIIIQFPRDQKLYRINSLINIGTFILFRLTALAWMTRWLVVNREAVHAIPYTIGSVGMALILLMNLILFYRLMNSDFIKRQKSSKKNV